MAGAYRRASAKSTAHSPKVGIEISRGLPASSARDHDLDPALLGDGPGQCRLTGARRADQEHAFVHRRPGNASRQRGLNVEDEILGDPACFPETVQLTEAGTVVGRDLLEALLHPIAQELHCFVSRQVQLTRDVEIGRHQVTRPVQSGLVPVSARWFVEHPFEDPGKSAAVNCGEGDLEVGDAPQGLRYLLYSLASDQDGGVAQREFVRHSIDIEEDSIGME